MNKIILCLFIIAMFAACNNNAVTGDKIPGKDTASQVVTTDTIVVKESVAAPEPPFNNELSAAEMQDDSVFADGSQPASWANAGFDHPIEFKKFLKRLQNWVANNQKDSVASVITFPLKNSLAKNKTAFIKNYDSLINEKVKKALFTQNMRQIFRRDQGAMIGSGELWFNETKKGFTIITINNN